ncbi:MAG: hypothetical protein WAW73_06230 [Rhodoferax sp.]
MNRHIFSGAFLLGALAVGWVAFGFLGSNALALLMTLIIGAVYAFGALELHRFRQASTTLSNALSAIPPALSDLEPWLAGVHPSLQNAVRLRIEGERVGLPGPMLTPYLVGLLVMLGMLGTFLGMVVTLNGAVFALEGTTDLQAIRSAFAAPIKGLGLAFGTSVAGVATSAMLGLMSAISRRDRMVAVHRLDTRIATVLRGFSLTHQRRQAYQALQLQSQALPAVVDQLHALMARVEGMHQQLSTALLSNQQSFHQDVKGVYTELAHSVDQSLRTSLTEGARAAGESIRPVIEAAMAGISQESKALHERLVATTGQQLQGMSERLSESHAAQQASQASGDSQRLQAWKSQLDTMLAAITREWQTSGEQTLSQQQAICDTLTRTAQEITEQSRTSAAHTLAEMARLLASSEALAQSRMAAESAWSTQQDARMDQLVSMLRTELGALRDEETVRGQAAVERLGELQAAVTQHLSTLGTALEDPITRLIQTASEAPRAAAEVIGKLRQEVSSSVARDNALLEERARIMETLSALLDAINHASVEQRAVIDSMVASSAVALGTAGSQFAEQVDAEAAKLADIAAQVTSSAVEVSALGETLGFAVQAFSDANDKLITSLQRIEGALDKSMVRSDEQLAYYVAQAREVIDLSIMSQKEIVGELHRLSGKPARLAAEVAG